MSIPTGFTPITSVLGTGTTGTPTTTGASTANGDIDKDAFLKLLVAQLKYQDPDKPVDSSEFMSQTAQFTSVEKLTSLVQTQASLLTSQNMLSASALVGRTVTYPGADGSPVTGVVGSARFSTDGAVLRVGDVDVPLTSVTSVAATATA